MTRRKKARKKTGKRRKKGGLPSAVFNRRNKLRIAKMRRFEKLHDKILPKLIQTYNRLAGGSLNPTILKSKSYKV